MSEVEPGGSVGIEPRVNEPAARPRFRLRRPTIDAPKSRRARVKGLWRSTAHALEQRQLFVLLPFAMIAGVIVSLLASAEPAPWALAAVGVAIALVLWFARRSLVATRLAALAAAFWIGFSLLTIHGALFGTPMLRGAAYGAFQARIDDVLADAPEGRRVIISAITPVLPTQPVPFRRARVLIKNGPPVAPGDIVAGNIYFYAVPGPALPQAFDAEFAAYFEGIGAYGSATSLKLVRSADAPAPDRLVDTIRQTISARIDAVLTQPSAGIARAIINGDQTEVQEGPRKIMATAGLAHVLAISGLHLSLVAGSVFFVLRLLLALAPPVAGRLDVKKVAASGAIVTALAYYAISGGGAAALRSTIMAVLIFAAVLFGRRALSMRNIAIAGLATVLIEPTEIFRPGFQLSFAAVIGLVGVYEMLHRPRLAGRGLLGFVVSHYAGIAVTSVIAGTATLVFAIYHFQQTSPLGIVGNLVLMPLVAFVLMPSAMLAVLLMPLGLERPFIQIMGWSIDRMLDVAAVIAGWSEHINATPILTPVALVIALGALAWFAFFTNRWRLLGPAFAVPAVLLFTLDHPPDVLVSDTTQAVAVSDAGGYALIAGRPGSFATNIWSETYKQPIGAPPPAMKRCDALGCVTRSPQGFVVAISRSLAALDEDCRSADLVIARMPGPDDCRAETTVVDAADLARDGVLWLRWDETSRRFEIRPSVTGLNRPWRAGR